jgi:uncharacterized protein (DUF2141 family)
LQSACRAAAHEANLDKPVTDENNNNRLDTDFIGYPIEGYALSDGIRAVISRLRFIDAAFSVGAQDAQVTLRIKY